MAALERPESEGTATADLARLRRQTALLEQLAAALVRQRAAVAADRVAEVHASVDELQHILHALALSRRESPAAATSSAGTPDLEDAQRALRAAAQAARREAAINRDVLNRGRAAGERFLQDWFSRIDAPDGYGPADTRPVAGGRIVDRRG